MRRFAMAALALSAALCVSGCVTDGISLPSPSIPSMPSGASVNQVIADVQAGVVKGCGYVVEFKSVADMVAAFGVPYVGMAADFASQVCGVLTAPVTGRTAKRPVVSVRGKVIVIRAHRAPG